MISLIHDRTLTLQADLFAESAALTLMSTGEFEVYFRLSENMKEKARSNNWFQKDIDGIIEHLENFNDVWARTIEVAIGTWLLERQVGATCVVPLILTLGKHQALGQKNVYLSYLCLNQHVWVVRSWWRRR